ncbi:MULTISPECIES: helix-turn-helix domain-containing protein [Thermogemmatispora]|uniref:helix-turn-helix domain-containing protein n=1 Tax=Thermogemmatispora TaxID=768669 RepID=UPI0008530FA0|nr:MULTISPECIES: helix-turn-helix domain-containing protein [Thermogemmatispora]
MPTIEEYLDRAKWTRSDLAREAGLDYQTVVRAAEGLPVQPRTLRAIAQALSKGVGEKVEPRDLSDVKVIKIRRKGKA